MKINHTFNHQFVKMDFDRKIGPTIQPLTEIKLPEVSFYSLTNGIPVYEVNTGTQDAFKVEILTIGGRLLEDKQLVSRATSVLLRDATLDYSQKELAEKLDFYGATLGTKHSMDVTSLTLFALGKYSDALIPVLASIYLRPKFNESELNKYVQRNINNLQIQLTKNDVLAYREFTSYIFGAEHIYGYNSTREAFMNLNIEDLTFHYNTYYGLHNTVIILSGKINEGLRNLIDRELGQFKKESLLKGYSLCQEPIQRKEYKIKGKNNIQDSIIIGRRLFDKEHIDYPNMVVANTLLGGYFGSRLMKVIREKKGYTYNISSILDMMKYDGFTYITTDVDPENTQETISEIYNQIDIIQQMPISDGELQMVKNYILGNILNMLDGPFKISSWVKSLIVNDLSLLRGHEIINEIKHCSVNDIKSIMQKYYQKENLSELIVTSS